MTATRSGRMLVSAAALVVVLAGLKAAAGIVGPTALALALTVLLHPVRSRLGRRMPTWAASVVVLLGAYLLIAALTLALVVSAAQLASLVPTYASELDDLSGSVHSTVTSMGFDEPQAKAAAGALDVGRLVEALTALMGGIVSLLSSFALVLTLMLFMAFDGASTERLAAGARRHRPDLVAALESFAQGTRTYLGVSAIFGLIVAVVDTVMLWGLGVPGALVWGALAFVTNFIPNIGFVIGLVPPALVALLEGGPDLMVVVVVLYCVVNLVIQSVIQPRYVGSAVGLSTTLTFLSLVFWAWVLGPIGALLAVPMSLLVKALLIEADPDGTWREPLVSGQPGDLVEEPPPSHRG
ncbi:AI-2E family transporter [Nocardioides sp. zg-1308]|uniref:AI-2E family transporter n=1 Tax=Nocardioides sp. zg-1308 TaxID=2736253 RepID=UPI0015553FAD|nr:AI-2E family transporter [Nocardioides sp. zg-1308]NPD06120.1 AI-2E family transporter [Nocardioides sp. zg-1308]